MDPLPAEVIILPRSDLGHDEAVSLGEIIKAYLQNTGNSESIWNVLNRSGVTDLLAGEMPKPLGLVLASEYRSTEEHARQRTDGGFCSYPAHMVAETVLSLQSECSHGLPDVGGIPSRPEP